MSRLKATVPWDTDDHCWVDLVDAPTRRQYQHYARDLGVGANPAVVLIDIYNLVFAGGDGEPSELAARYPSSCGRYAQAALPAIGSLLETARSLDLPIFHVTVGAGAGVKATNRTSASDDDDYAFHPVVTPRPGEPIIRKDRASAFYGTSLSAALVTRGIDTVVVAGETTSGCVRASVVDGYSHGFHMVMVEDAVFDRNWLSHRVNLFDLHHKYADVMQASTVLPLLEQVAGKVPAAAGATS